MSEPTTKEILEAAGKPLRMTCRVLIFLGEHPDQEFTVAQLAEATELTPQQVRSAVARLAGKQKIKRTGGRKGTAMRYQDNPEYTNNRPANVPSRTAQAKLAYNRVPVGFQSFAKYLPNKLEALDKAIKHCQSEADKDMLIRIRYEYESLQLQCMPVKEAPRRQTMLSRGSIH